MQVSEALKTVAKTFPGRSGDVRDGPVISWRTLHHPKRNSTPRSFLVFMREERADSWPFRLHAVLARVLDGPARSQDTP